MRVEAEWLTSRGALAVMRALVGAGHQAFFVGGCVRNAVLGAAATDVDIATDAVPERVMEVAKGAGLKAVPTGIEHGTVTVVADGQGFEVTTFRRDVETDGRRAVVAFSGSLEEDARRRDFTMNALYADADGQVTDPVGGLPDLAARRVRFIGNPHDRICEDYLRILRFFRFHAWYADPEGGIEAEAFAACAELAEGIETLSRERIGAEMLKLLAAPDPAPAVASMAACGVLLRVAPGAGALTLAPLVHVESRLGLPPDPIARLAALGGEDLPDRLRLSKADARRLARLSEAAASGAGAAELGYRLGAEDGLRALALDLAMRGAEPDPVSGETVQNGAARTFPVAAADLPPDLQGAAIGARLAQLERAWIDSGFTLIRERLLALPDEDA
ncbi:CCA tRNA nucleotidyltransferase [Wenxinia marina]|uniref:tRNA nucleotidyltransferase/poly(A) polymerase n=1 Tax=Wenxinia marina DSM 24838 TaxID=1123501 RepID=A0A0D0Q9D3_9RHOB|nr:CCA tRNA nucleotidyltransferase [Wenxinia marina]KIQ71034.1 tRNA nucleotidyltransferase/poly(A) polymerase [Wenxinia marina DSM 24838]GGL55400.1 poly(A) polymerase [Wenxinia marina]